MFCIARILGGRAQPCGGAGSRRKISTRRFCARPASLPLSATGGKAGTGAVVGGAVGAVAGNLWSKRMEEKRAAMEKATQGTGIGVERTFLLHSPRVDKVEVMRNNKVRRAKLYYLRDRRGKSARLKGTGAG